MSNSGHHSLTTAEEGGCEEPASPGDDQAASTERSLSDPDVCDLTALQRDVLTAVATLSRGGDSESLPLGRDVYDRLTEVRAKTDELNRSHTYQTLRWLDSQNLIESWQSAADSRANEYKPTDCGMIVLDALASRYAYVTAERPSADRGDQSAIPPLPDDDDDNVTESPMRSDGGSVAPSSASTVRATRARGVAKTLRNHLVTADSESISLLTAARVSDTTERLCLDAVDARSEWFGIDDHDPDTDRPKQIRLTDCGTEAATDDPYFDPKE